MDTDMKGRQTYTVPEAAELLGIGRAAAYLAAKRGDIPAIFIGKRVIVPKGPLKDMIANPTRHITGDGSTEPR